MEEDEAVELAENDLRTAEMETHTLDVGDRVLHDEADDIGVWRVGEVTKIDGSTRELTIAFDKLNIGSWEGKKDAPKPKLKKGYLVARKAKLMREDQLYKAPETRLKKGERVRIANDSDEIKGQVWDYGYVWHAYPPPPKQGHLFDVRLDNGQLYRCIPAFEIWPTAGSAARGGTAASGDSSRGTSSTRAPSGAPSGASSTREARKRPASSSEEEGVAQEQRYSASFKQEVDRRLAQRRAGFYQSSGAAETPSSLKHDIEATLEKEWAQQHRAEHIWEYVTKHTGRGRRLGSTMEPEESKADPGAAARKRPASGAESSDAGATRPSKQQASGKDVAASSGTFTDWALQLGCQFSQYKHNSCHVDTMLVLHEILMLASKQAKQLLPLVPPLPKETSGLGAYDLYTPMGRFASIRAELRSSQRAPTAAQQRGLNDARTQTRYQLLLRSRSDPREFMESTGNLAENLRAALWSRISYSSDGKSTWPLLGTATALHCMQCHADGNEAGTCKHIHNTHMYVDTYIYTYTCTYMQVEWAQDCAAGAPRATWIALELNG